MYVCRGSEALQVIPGEPDATVTSMQISQDRRYGYMYIYVSMYMCLLRIFLFASKLYVGMSTGAIRVYNWPPHLPHGHNHSHASNSATTNTATSNAVSNALSSTGKNPNLTITGLLHIHSYIHTYIHIYIHS